jgi:hypothetical protein
LSFALRALVFLAHVRPQARDRRGGQLWQLRHYPALDEAYRSKDLARLLDCRTSDIGAAIRKKFDDAVGREAPQDWADDRPTPAEHLAKNSAISG